MILPITFYIYFLSFRPSRQSKPILRNQIMALRGYKMYHRHGVVGTPRPCLPGMRTKAVRPFRMETKKKKKTSKKT